MPKLRIRLPLGYKLEWWGWGSYGESYVCPIKMHLTGWSAELGTYWTPVFSLSLELIHRKNYWAKRGVYINAELLGFKLEPTYGAEETQSHTKHECGEYVYETDRFCSNCGGAL